MSDSDFEYGTLERETEKGGEVVTSITIKKKVVGSRKCRRKDEVVVSEKVDSSASAGSCNGGKHVLQRQNKRGRPLSCLPPAYEKLLNFYDAVDSVLCFLIKNRIPTKVANVQSMVSKTYNGMYGNNETMLMQLRSILRISQGAVRVERVSEAELDESYLNVTFTSIGGTGAARRNKRLKLVREGLEKYYLQHSESLLLPPPPPPSISLHQSLNMPDLPPPVDLPGSPEPKKKKKSNDSPLIPTTFATGTMMKTSTNDEQPEVKIKGLCTGSGLLSYLQTLPFYKDQIAYKEFKPSQSAVFCDLENPLPLPLAEAIKLRYGISRFYQHQVKAINAAVKGKHVAISTSTSSGKSMIFNIPVLSSILNSAPGTCIALYLYPTKALAQDQLRHLKSLVSENSEMGNAITLACVDGDADYASRSHASKSVNILLSNPDFLHASLLPNHKRWSRVLQRLRFVVLDEAHTYKGGFGAHVSCVMRRLLRLHSIYSKHFNPPPPPPQFICCSATMENTEEHFAALLPLEGCLGGRKNLCCVLSKDDTAPKGSKTLILWRPPIITTTDAAQNILKASSSPNPLPPFTTYVSIDSTTKKFLKKTKLIFPASSEECSNSSGSTSSFQSSNHHYMLDNSCRGGGTTVMQQACCGVSHLKHKHSTTQMMASEGVENDSILQDKNSVGELRDFSKANVKLDCTAVENGESEVFLRRTSPILEISMIFSALVKRGIRTLAFCRTRKLTELVLQYALEDLETTANSLINSVMAYRGGYTKAARRSIESKLFCGKLLGVTATSALELGIDVGDIDVTLHLGFPGSISSFWQQAGRAGRGMQESLAIMVLFQDPISNYFLRVPEELFCKPPESVIVDSNNELVLRSHLLCAAVESPLAMIRRDTSATTTTNPCGLVNDVTLFGGSEIYQSQVDYLSSVKVSGNSSRTTSPLVPGPNGTWVGNPGLYFYRSPTRDVSLRVIDPISFEVIDAHSSCGGALLDTVEYSRAFFCLFEGAIWLNQAKQYKIVRLDIVNHIAHAIPVNVQYFTSSRNNTTINVTKIIESDATGLISTGCVDIVDTVYGYVKCWRRSGESFEHGECSLPPLEYSTRAFWIDISPAVRQAVEVIEGSSMLGGVHAATHAILTVVTMILTVDPSDMDCEHARIGQARPGPTRIIVFDKCPGGLGISDALFSRRSLCLQLALNLLKDCVCHRIGGCPRCVASHSCTDYNSILDKNTAIVMLSLALEETTNGSDKHPALAVNQENNVRRIDTVSSSLIDGMNCCYSSSSSPERHRHHEKHNVECLDDEDESITPKKKMRKLNLVVAKSMDEARTKAKGIRKGWVDSDHNYFISENT